MAKVATIEMGREILKIFGRRDWTAADLAAHKLGTKNQIRSFLNDGKLNKVCEKVCHRGGNGKDPAVWRLTGQFMERLTTPPRRA